MVLMSTSKETPPSMHGLFWIAVSSKSSGMTWSIGLGVASDQLFHSARTIIQLMWHAGTLA